MYVSSCIRVNVRQARGKEPSRRGNKEGKKWRGFAWVKRPSERRGKDEVTEEADLCTVFEELINATDRLQKEAIYKKIGNEKETKAEEEEREEKEETRREEKKDRKRR